MTEEVLEAFIRSYIEASPGPTISFTWHGGEPTLAGRDFYEKVIALEKKYLPEGFEVWNNLQTNGLLLEEDFCDFLAENHFDVGISIDGTAFCHDFYRKDATGAATYERTVAAIRRLQKRGIQPDLLCTVNALTAQHGREVYKALRDLSTGWMQFIPVVVKVASEGADPKDDKVTRDAPKGAKVIGEGTPTNAYAISQDSVTPQAYAISADSVTPEAYGTFLKDVFSEWFFHDLGKTEVQLFSETARALAGKEPTLCSLAPTCGNVLVVEKDGGIYSCDHFVDKAHRIGSVLTDDFQDLLQGEFQKEFGLSKKTAMSRECEVCPYLSLCGGGCQKDRFQLLPAGGKVERPKYVLCEGLRAYFDYAVPRLKRAMALSSQGKGPAEIMQTAVMAERALFKSVGRNDLCPCGSGLKFKHCCQKRVP